MVTVTLIVVNGTLNLNKALINLVDVEAGAPDVDAGVVVLVSGLIFGISVGFGVLV